MNDAGPLATYRYTLDWQDGLAYERLPRGLTGLQSATLYIWLGLAGILLVALPPDVAGEVNTPRFWLTGAGLVLLQYVIFWLARGIRRLNRARFRYPATVEVEVGLWPDRLQVRSGEKPVTIPFEDIGALLPTAQRLFIAAGPELVIMPAAAFPDAAGMQRPIELIDGYMRQRLGTPGEASAERGAAS